MESILSTQHNDKELHITYVSQDMKYALATYEADKKSKLFKIDIDTLSLSDKESALLAKANSKHQF